MVDISKYRIAITGKKLYWSLCMHLLDASMHNVWVLHKCSEHDVPNLKFKREMKY